MTGFLRLAGVTDLTPANTQRAGAVVGGRSVAAGSDGIALDAYLATRQALVGHLCPCRKIAGGQICRIATRASISTRGGDPVGVVRARIDRGEIGAEAIGHRRGDIDGLRMMIGLMVAANRRHHHRRQAQQADTEDDKRDQHL